MKIVRLFMELLRILLTVTRPYCYTILDIIYAILLGPKVTLPPINDRLLLIPAKLLAKNIRTRKLRAEDVMKAYIERIKQTDSFINAYVDHRFEEALKEAKEVDLFLSTNTRPEEEIERNTPLLGVPFTCKEVLGVKGLAQTCGIYSARKRKAPRDGDCAALYRKAGGIPVVVTNVPELCAWWETASLHFGRTFNPYSRLRCPGGTSGGETSLVASAGAVMGVGNDLAGSIRVPAAFNGVYAHKPSPGMISNLGFWPQDSDTLNHYIGSGPICRYAQDLPLLASILSGGKIKFERKVDFSKVKIYYMENFPGYLLRPIPDITTAVRKAANYFEETFGNKPTEICIPELKYATQMFECKMLEIGNSLRDSLADSEKRVNLLLEFIKVVLRCSEHTLMTVYAAAIERSEMDSEYHKFIAMFNVLKVKLDSIMEGDTLLLTPTHPEPALHHYTTFPKHSNKAYTSIFNILGYPATQIPAGLSDGLPIGIQAISFVNNDHLCITAAVELEKLFGGWRSPSPCVGVEGN